MTDYRRYKVALGFSIYNLIPNLTALENVELAKQVCNRPESEEALRIVGLKDRIHNFPAQLSGGEQQRVAICEGHLQKPRPSPLRRAYRRTGYRNGKTVLGVLSTSPQHGKNGGHHYPNSLVAPIADRQIEMKNGRVVKESQQASPADLEGIRW